jgi:hypothetical protein
MTQLIKIAVSGAIALSFIACAGEQPAPQVEGCNMAGPNSPMWVCEPMMEGSITAIGVAQKSPAGVGFQRTEATAQGRDELTRILNLKVSNMVKSFAQSTGIGEAQTMEKVSSQVSKQVASETLSGSRVVKTHVNQSNGELFVLMAIDTQAVQDYAKKAVATSMKNDEALYQQFMAKKAQEELEKEIEKLK